MKKVSLSLRIELPDGSRRYVKPHPKKSRCTADGVYHEEAVYVARFTSGGKQRWETVGRELELGGFVDGHIGAEDDVGGTADHALHVVETCNLQHIERSYDVDVPSAKWTVLTREIATECGQVNDMRDPNTLDDIRQLVEIGDVARDVRNQFFAATYNPSIMQTGGCTPMWLVSFLSGGLAGGCVSVFLNRWFHWREMRVKFYPVLNNMFSAYVIRMGNPEGRYLVTTVGMTPTEAHEDYEFVNHRANFITDLIQFNELREARKLRKDIVTYSMTGDHTEGKEVKRDLMPDYQALNECMKTLHKKLKID
jgi:hypothetical protein